VQIDHEKDKNADGAPEQAGMTSMQRLLYQLHQVNCRLVLVGTSDTRFPMFLEKVLNATNMAHCQVDIYEPNPRLNFLLEVRPQSHPVFRRAPPEASSVFVMTKHVVETGDSVRRYCLPWHCGVYILPRSHQLLLSRLQVPSGCIESSSTCSTVVFCVAPPSSTLCVSIRRWPR
jgi:hypothetical protein